METIKTNNRNNKCAVHVLCRQPNVLCYDMWVRQSSTTARGDHTAEREEEKVETSYIGHVNLYSSHIKMNIYRPNRPKIAIVINCYSKMVISMSHKKIENRMHVITSSRVATTQFQ